MHALALTLVLNQAPDRKPVDLRSLLAEAVDPATCARLPDPAYSLRSTSFEATVGEVPGETLVADLEGPGALVSLEVRGNPGTIRIRLDGNEAPLLVAPGAPAALEGIGPPFLVRSEDAWILRLPVPYARRCRVEWNGALRGTCEVVYRAYAPGTRVQTVTVDEIRRARDAIARANEAWMRPIEPPGADTFTFSLSEEIPEGGLTCLDPKNARGPRAITQIHLRAEATDLGRALRSGLLRLAFDGETSVVCPLGDFFAVAPRDEIHVSRPFSVLPGVDEATGRPGTQLELVCRFVMPYRERFDLSIDAKGAGDLHVAGVVRTMPWEWNERSMRFHAAWRSSGPLPAQRDLEGPRLRIEGHGVLVGESCSIGLDDDHVRAWGARVRTDGGGTISDRLPAIGSTRISRRFRELDRVPFQSSLESATTLRLDREGEVHLASTTYYYALPGARDDAPKIGGSDHAIPRPEKEK